MFSNPLENIVPYMRDGENCEQIDHAEFDNAVDRIRACLALHADEIMRRKQECRRSAKFHPLILLLRQKCCFPTLEVRLNVPTSSVFEDISFS